MNGRILTKLNEMEKHSREWTWTLKDGSVVPMRGEYSPFEFIARNGRGIKPEKHPVSYHCAESLEPLEAAVLQAALTTASRFINN
ncbi:hypothetical protein CAFE_20640 [Caprobacter fermentans]|uniref:Uncharacterized protein n=1 Tax=Caproicibacter fermentans TaxID=2576756 RepID=A0A6N8I0S4_9FIRM|nr:hypothetical protein [Caproicibacter fermentans]MVB11350.1 hypothetical protein [Caproicibacter fermentans]